MSPALAVALVVVVVAGLLVAAYVVGRRGRPIPAPPLPPSSVEPWPTPVETEEHRRAQEQIDEALEEELLREADRRWGPKAVEEYHPLERAYRDDALNRDTARRKGQT